MNRAVFVDVAIFDAERTFDKLRRHTEQTRAYHPKCCTRATNTDRDRDAGDVAEANSAGDGSCESLKMVAFAVMASAFNGS